MLLVDESYLKVNYLNEAPKASIFIVVVVRSSKFGKLKGLLRVKAGKWTSQTSQLKIDFL